MLIISFNFRWVAFKRITLLSDDLQVEDEEMNEVENGANLETLCKHDLILDEQMGIKCRFCSFIKLEIRYVLPPMVSTPSMQRHNNFL